MFGKKNEIGRIRDLYIAGAIAGYIGPRPAYIFRSAAIAACRSHESAET